MSSGQGAGREGRDAWSLGEDAQGGRGRDQPPPHGRGPSSSFIGAYGDLGVYPQADRRGQASGSLRSPGSQEPVDVL